MGFWSQIADNLKTDEVLATFGRAQCEALVDALLLMVLADGEASFLELQELEHMLHELPWALKNAQRIDDYTEHAARQIAALTTEAQKLTVAQEVGARLGTTESKKRVFKMAAKLAYANWDASSEEHHALMLLANGFHIPEPFAQAILEDVHAEQNNPPQGLDGSTNAEDVPAAVTNTVRDVLNKDFLKGFFSDLFDDDDLKHLDEEAALAFVDALCISLVADGYPEPEELQEFKTQLEQLPFSHQDISHIQARVEITINSLRSASNDAQLTLIQGVSAKLPSQPLRERAFKMAVAISNADFAITQNEQAMLYRIAQGFDIDAERAKRLIGEVRATQDHGLFES